MKGQVEPFRFEKDRMKPLTLEEIVQAMEGSASRGVPPGTVARVTIDSREVKLGDLFFAIRGKQFDGHDFVGQAAKAGAIAAVVRNDFEAAPVSGDAAQGPDSPPGLLLIRVDDPVKALGRLARYYRRRVIEGAVTVIAVTGSNGKTTTKAMIAHVLAGRWRGRASVKSFNNELGVPLTLLSVEPSDEFVVCEVGTNAPGEIAALAKLVEPGIAVLTCIAEVHLQGLSSVQGVATEKLSLFHSLQADGFGVLNVDHELIRWSLEHDRKFAQLKKVTFGEWPQADLRLTDVRSVISDDGSDMPVLEFTVNDRFSYRLRTLGKHNACNALAAIGVARRMGMDHPEIAERLATFDLPAMRLQAQRLGRLTLINDAYNANPASMAAAVEVLTSLPTAGRRVLVIGDMLELGERAEAHHRTLAETIAASNINVLIAIGDHARQVTQHARQVSGGRLECHAYATTTLAKRRICAHLQPTDVVLMKGSRVLALEQLVDRVGDWASGKSAGKAK